MEILSLSEIGNVSGGNILVDLVLGKVIDLVAGAVLSGQVDYAGLVVPNGSNYNMLGA